MTDAPLPRTVSVERYDRLSAALGFVPDRVRPAGKKGDHAQVKRLREWWVLQRALTLTRFMGDAPLPWKITARERPDFIVCDGNGTIHGVEIVEATHPRDKRERAEMFGRTRPVFLGEHGGRKLEDLSANDFLADIERTISTNKNAGYANSIEADRRVLLVYCNSNASAFLESDEILTALATKADLYEFIHSGIAGWDQVVVLLSDNGKWLSFEADGRMTISLFVDPSGREATTPLEQILKEHE